MQLLQKCKGLGATREEMRTLWISYCRSVLENSCVIWHSSLTEENANDLERTQKTFCKLTLKNKYDTYENALLLLNLQSLQERREEIC